jgi:hypothetical protein
MVMALRLAVVRSTRDTHLWLRGAVSTYMATRIWSARIAAERLKPLNGCNTSFPETISPDVGVRDTALPAAVPESVEERVTGVKAPTVRLRQAMGGSHKG